MNQVGFLDNEYVDTCMTEVTEKGGEDGFVMTLHQAATVQRGDVEGGVATLYNRGAVIARRFIPELSAARRAGSACCGPWNRTRAMEDGLRRLASGELPSLSGSLSERFRLGLLECVPCMGETGSEPRCSVRVVLSGFDALGLVPIGWVGGMLSL